MSDGPIDIFSRYRPIPEGYRDESVEMLNGRLRITEYGHESLGRTAKKLGIDLHSIHCFNDYLRVRELMAPYFFQRMAESLEDKPDTLEFNALRAIVAGDQETLQIIIDKLNRRNRMVLKVVKEEAP